MRKRFAGAAVLCGALILACSCVYAQITDVTLSNGTLDRAFQADRTLYYIELQEDKLTVPTITADGAMVIKTAENTVSADPLKRLTVLKDNETGTEYRFVINRIMDEMQIDECMISPKGVLSLKGETGNPVNIMIYRPKEPGANESALPSDIDKTNMQTSVLDIMRIDGGKLELEYPFPTDTVSGMYTIFVNEENGKTVYRKQLYYASETDLEDLLKEFNALTDISGFRKFLQENAAMLNIDLTDFSKFSDYSLFEGILGKNFDSIDKALQAYYDILAVSAVNNATEDGMLEILFKYKDTLGLSVETVYEKLECPANIVSMMLKKGFKTIDDVNEAFNEACAVIYINEAEPNEMKDRFEDNKTTLKISDEVYKKYESSSKDKVLRKLTNKNFKSGNELRTALEMALNGKNETGTGGGGSSSGAGNSTGNKNVGVIPPPGKGSDYIPEKEPEINLSIEIFNDLDDVEWAKEAILLLHDWKVINGKEEHKFAPNDFVTREEFIQMLMKALNLKADNKKCEFADVPKEAWYYDTVASAYTLDIVNGVSETEFGAGQEITRQDMAVMLQKAAETAEIKITAKKLYSKFTDEDSISEYALESVKKLTRAGIINGIEEGVFAPEATATRAMAAVMIYRTIQDM